jgi:nucleotide-binding universal stress UspA family protein
VASLPPGLDVDTVVVEGAAGPAILEVAADAGADLIVVGARDRGPVAQLLLGSVSRDVVRDATVPVVVAPQL